ncbi:MAG TPA: DUF4097 family beta strand repeat-containing protein [Candidatus Polarisedimenticolia bacterium]|nr:DUF4097 family beta strand repeat-containing protein [Candidatus Polarisedimenticolia bacterium]
MKSLILPALLLAAGGAARAEATRTERLELAITPGAAFAVENLAGTMRVVAGTGSKVTAVAVLHAESAEVLAKMALTRVDGASGEQILRVVYPTADYGAVRYDGSGQGDSGWLSSMFGGNSNTTTKYAGEKVRVSSGKGTLMYAEVEVQVPSAAADGAFRNVVGDLDANGLSLRKMTFDSGSGNLSLVDLTGDVGADTGSGDIKASRISGSFDGDTGSGDISLTDLDGDSITCDTGSGDIEVRDVVARTMDADTGSGDILAAEVDLEEFKADTGSGDVELLVKGGRLTSVDADTGSGNVVLGLGPDASFEARGDIGSGDIESRFSDAEAITQGREVVGYRRGGGRTRVSVSTGSGDLVLKPGR